MAKKSGKSRAKRASTKSTVRVTPNVKPAKKPVSAPTAVVSKPRRLKLGNYQSLRLQKRIKHPVKLPSVWQLSKTAAGIIGRHKKLFISLTLVYGLLNLVLVQGFAAGSTDVSTLKQALNSAVSGHFGPLTSSLLIFTQLVGAAGNSSSPTAGAYQLFLAIITSLAIIWTLRQLLAGSQLKRVRDAYYLGMYPLIPFMLVLGVIGLQLIPLLIGSTLYGLVVSGGIAVYAVEKIVWALLYGVLALLSVYMISSSLFALYIVTLPDMTPLSALRSARELVRYRRWTVLRKILALPIILLIGAAIIMVPIIILLTPLAQWVFFLLTMFALVAVHAYMYTLYRELLND